MRQAGSQPGPAPSCQNPLKLRTPFPPEDPSPAPRQASLEAGADAYWLRPFPSGELLAQVRAFFRLRELHERLSEKSAEVLRINQRLQQAHQLIDLELELARRIQ